MENLSPDMKMRIVSVVEDVVDLLTSILAPEIKKRKENELEGTSGDSKKMYKETDL